jgi:hypothetical protein
VSNGPAAETGAASSDFQNEMDGQRQGRLITNAKFSLGRKALRGNHTVNLLSTKENVRGLRGSIAAKEIRMDDFVK